MATYSDTEPQEHAQTHAGNGAASQAESAYTSPEQQAAFERAEEIVDRATQRLGHYASLAKHQIARLAARAREEAEDMWAEAQSLRHGDRP